MAVYERSTHVDAPLSEVWAFHSNERGLTRLTPGWLHLRIESTEGPGGDPDPEVLVAGSTVVASVRPFGVGPRQRWTSRIVARSEHDDHAVFRDEMVEGPFADWEHTHRFVAEDGGTRVTDHVEYRLLDGALGRLAGPVAVVGFEPMFAFRHRRTRQLLE